MPKEGQLSEGGGARVLFVQGMDIYTDLGIHEGTGQCT